MSLFLLAIFTCDHCCQKLQADEHLRGQTCKCPKCQQPSLVPADSNEENSHVPAVFDRSNIAEESPNDEWDDEWDEEDEDWYEEEASDNNWDDKEDNDDPPYPLQFPEPQKSPEDNSILLILFSLYGIGVLLSTPYFE